MCACRIVPISSSLCVLKGCKLVLFNSCFFLSLGPLSPTSKEINESFFIIVLLYFRLRYSKTTSTVCKVVHPASNWCVRPSSVLARPNISNVAYWPASSVWVFIAQLGEHCSANAEATGSNPVEAPKIFFSGYFRNCLNCDSLRWSHTHFISIPAVHITFIQNTVCLA